MIAAVAEWIRSVLLVTFIVTLVRMVLPDNGLRPFVRVVMGFVVLAVLIQPLFAIVENPSRWGDLLNDYWNEGAVRSSASWMAVGEEIRSRSEQMATHHLAERLGAQIEAIVTLLPEVDGARVGSLELTDTGVHRLILGLVGQAEPGEPRVRELLEKYFGIASESVFTRWNVEEGE